jgi:acyl-CoA synthetase (AMP-forming)/AMP-acid ligase II
MTPARFKSTFYPTILFHSRVNPESVAVAFGSQEVTYREFVRDIERATRQLASRVPPGPRLAMVALVHPYLHWVLTIALGRVGITSVSGYDPAGSGLLDLVKADLVFIDNQTVAADERFVEVTADWIGLEADQLPPFVDPDHAADAPLRLVLSSGTTGTPKKILLTHALNQYRLHGMGLLASFQGNRSRSMTLVGLDTAGGYQFPTTTWFLGGCAVLYMPGEDPYQTIVRHGVTYAFMSPVQLEQLVGAMPARAWPLPGLTISVAGSRLPRRVSEMARARLTGSLVLIYGSTEAGMLATAHAGITDSMPDVTGIVRPDVEVQIVDPAGNPVPPGTVGELRSRSLEGIDQYLDAGTSGTDSEGQFRDGWFYPGDAAVLSDDGMLTVVGRTIELMNLGGVKLSPNVIEEALAACPGVVDIAAFALEQQGGVATPWVAVVRGPGYDQAALAAAFQRAFPRLPALKFVHADVIPRNQMGKIQRNIIQERVRRTLQDGA